MRVRWSRRSRTSGRATRSVREGLMQCTCSRRLCAAVSRRRSCFQKARRCANPELMIQLKAARIPGDREEYTMVPDGVLHPKFAQKKLGRGMWVCNDQRVVQRLHDRRTWAYSRRNAPRGCARRKSFAASAANAYVPVPAAPCPGGRAATGARAPSADRCGDQARGRTGGPSTRYH